MRWHRTNGRIRIYYRLVMQLATAVILAVAILTFTAVSSDMLWPIIVADPFRGASEVFRAGDIPDGESGAYTFEEAPRMTGRNAA